MRRIQRSPSFALLLHVVVVATAIAAAPQANARRESFSSRKTLPNKLPAKAPAKRTFVDFSKDETAVVLSPRALVLERALKTSDRDLKSARNVSTPTTTVRSRKILAAPEGDSAEPMSSMATAKPSPTVVEKPSASTTFSAKASPPVNVFAKSPPAPVAKPPPPTEKIETSFARPMTPPTPLRPPIPIEPFVEFPAPAETSRTVVRPLPPTESVAVTETKSDISSRDGESSPVEESIPPSQPAMKTGLSRRDVGDGFFKTIDAKTKVFIRAGYFNANYKKFDDRMKNGATSMGLGAARGLETSWGEFEVRAAFDIYHAMDQSVTVDNVRMFSARTEVAYWLSHSRVKPGLSLGLGMADYSIRSYRSISDSNEDLVTLKTHAKGRAFSIIPATSLRVELAEELVIDAQTEFMALLGSDSSDSAQGLGVNVSLGWTF
jgi:hypothetical protein